MRSFRSLFIRIPLCLLCLQLLSCASIGSPGGGPKDETPPVLVKTLPENNSRNYTKKKLEIYFDELVSVENASDRVIVSPPQKTPPQVNAIMTKIVVELQDSLKANETYTIDFTNSIVDLNERNPYGDYAFAFSTGPDIDTLRVSGIVLRADNLNPVRGILVGAHLDLSDSTFIKDPFLRISKTDTWGRFCIKNLKPGPYKIYALDDKNRDYRFDQAGEALAFPDSAVSLWTEICQRYDTTWIDSLTIDTIQLVDYLCYKPDDLLLKLYEEDFGRQYLVKSERPAKEFFSLIFGYKADSLPKIKLLSPGPTDFDEQTDSIKWYFCENNLTNDSLVYWIKDSSIYRHDTLHIQVNYFKTDSNNLLSPACDTLRLFTRKLASSARGGSLPDRDRNRGRRGDREQDTAAQVVPVDHLKLQTSLKPSLDIYSSPRFTWETPIKNIQGDPFSLYRKKDTLWIEITDFTVEPHPEKLRTYVLDALWDFEAQYKVEIDSGSVEGWYGKTNAKFSQSFTIKAEKEYSRLTVSIDGFEGPAFAELLDKSDKVVRKVKLEEGVADFLFLKPGDYYLRAIDDANDNLLWDTGNYAMKLQPEEVFYNNKLFNLKANWEINESWNIRDLPLTEQKPKDLKPAQAKRP